MDYRQVLTFWFAELTPADWWKKDPQLDTEIRRRFGPWLSMARCGECFSWRHSGPGRLAEILVLDQFSRNIHRDTSEAFAADGQALVLAQEALRARADQGLTVQQRAFMYMPYMHSESMAIQRTSLRLFRALGEQDNLRFAIAHHDIIARFGRFPHRNAILGRSSTEEEREFLRQPGSSF